MLYSESGTCENISATCQLMGAWQSGLDYFRFKRLFYTIRLAPQDCHRFAFSVPSINFKEPIFGMSCLRACQTVLYYTRHLRHRQYKIILYVIHFMGDILLAHKNKDFWNIWMASVELFPWRVSYCFRENSKATLFPVFGIHVLS